MDKGLRHEQPYEKQDERKSKKTRKETQGRILCAYGNRRLHPIESQQNQHQYHENLADVDMGILKKLMWVKTDKENSCDSEKICAEKNSRTGYPPPYFLIQRCRVCRDEGNKKKNDMNRRTLQDDLDTEPGMWDLHALNKGGNTQERQDKADSFSCELIERIFEPGIRKDADCQEQYAR